MKAARYIKVDLKSEVMVVRSVNITESQQHFLNKHNINLSALVRDAIKDLIKETLVTKEAK